MPSHAENQFQPCMLSTDKDWAKKSRFQPQSTLGLGAVKRYNTSKLRSGYPEIAGT